MSGVQYGYPLTEDLSCDPKKRSLFSTDTYFKESFEQLAQLTDNTRQFCADQAMLLLKPDAVAARRLEPAITWLGDNGYVIVAAERVTLTRHMLRALWHYQWNVATAERRMVADHLLTSTDSLVLVVRRQEPEEVPATVGLTARKGATDPEARTPGQLRYLLGKYTYLLNLVHTPDEPADLVRELGVYFDTARRESVYRMALSGADQSARARALAVELYADAPERDLSLTAATRELRTALEAWLTDGEGTAVLRDEVRDLLSAADEDDVDGWRKLLELLRLRGLSLAPWSAAVAGTYALPMKEPGISPVLPGVSPSDWLSRQG